MLTALEKAKAAIKRFDLSEAHATLLEVERQLSMSGVPHHEVEEFQRSLKQLTSLIESGISGIQTAKEHVASLTDQVGRLDIYDRHGRLNRAKPGNPISKKF